LKNKNAANSQKKRNMPFSPKREKKGYVFLVSVCILGNTLPNPKNDDVTVNHLFGYLWQPRRERPGNKTLPAPLTLTGDWEKK
jgi:hypothetical protein